MKTTNKNSEQENTAPVHSENSGRVRASVWETEVDGAKRYKITITRSFQEKDGAWKRGRTYFQSELAAVIEVAARAQRWIERQQRESQGQLQLAAT